eukprot:808003-Rhodomonas_salina.3
MVLPALPRTLLRGGKTSYVHCYACAMRCTYFHQNLIPTSAMLLSLHGTDAVLMRAMLLPGVAAITLRARRL